MLDEEAGRGHAGDDEGGGDFEGAPKEALPEVVAGCGRKKKKKESQLKSYER